MKFHIIAIGRAKQGAELALFNHYKTRIRSPFLLHEIEDKKKRNGAELKAAEAKLLIAAIPKGAIVIALDEAGRNFGSIELAKKIQAWDDQAKGEIAFIIGGADGLAKSVHQRADLIINFGKLTWPHMLVRAMLVEQIYRIGQIHAGHPYHRQ